jgi:hypothetical protein
MKDIFCDEITVNRIVDLLMKCDLEKKQTISPWKKCSDEQPEDDQTVLISYIDDQDTYSAPHRAYYLYGRFFSLENNNSHPIVADIWMKIPEVMI